jgi:hypothetical protein
MVCHVVAFLRPQHSNISPGQMKQTVATLNLEGYVRLFATLFGLSPLTHGTSVQYQYAALWLDGVFFVSIRGCYQ